MVPAPPSTKPALSYTHHCTLRGQDGVLWLEGCPHVRAGRPSLHERELREGLWLLRDGMTDSRTYARYCTTFSILTGAIEHSSDAI